MTLTQLPSQDEILIVQAEFPMCTPKKLFEYWTQPVLLQQWWPQQAEVQPGIGGNYHFSWPQMNWHLRGQYLSFEPGDKLAFTWQWDHDLQGTSPKEVVITFGPLAEGGTSFCLTHGPYTSAPEEQILRLDHHLTGWLHFLARLQEQFTLGILKEW